ncbi:MAG: transporter substrate-binding domain-containing protein, partial [Proteobacteria bacterium]|nr:transporter substrate-binding domain-containing protein [Pseudomonadota bacterium]
MKPHSKRYSCIRHFLFLVIGLFLFLVNGAPPAVAAQPPLLSGAELDYPPFSIVDEQGRATGFSVELMRAALATMDRTVTFKTGPWSEVKTWLEKSEIQALPLVGRTPEREQTFDFTFPYMSLHGALVVREDTAGVYGLADLTGRKVAVMKGDNTEEFLRRNDYGVDIVTTQTFETALRQLSEGRYDAVLILRLVGLRLIKEAGLTNLKVINQPVADFTQEFCFAVAEGDKDTLALLNEGLSLVIADGTYRYLHARWFSAMELPTQRKIVVGGDHNYPPYEYLDEKGQPAGYNVDLTMAIAKELGLNVQIKLGPWTRIVQEVQTGEVDILQGMFYSPERGLSFSFTPSHAVNHCVSVGRKSDGPPPETLEELATKKIVVQQGDIMHEFVLQKGFKDQTSAVNNPEAALIELVEGTHDCALISRKTALYLIQKHGWSQLAIGKTPFLSPEYCFAAPHNRKALVAEFSEGLRTLEKTGEFRQIQEKWMGVDEGFSPELTRALQYSGLVICALVIILLAVVLWSWMLRRQVAARTEELRKSQELQKAIVACSPVALYSIDFEGKVLTWNASAERIFGWKAEEVIGKPLPTIPESQYEEFNGLRRQIENQDRFVGKEVIRMKKDGTLFDGSLSSAPILDANGSLIGIMGAMEEITQRKKAEQQLK